MNYIEKSNAIKAEIAKRGLRLERRGLAWRVFGKGIDLIVLDLPALDLADLRPPSPPKLATAWRA